MPSSLSAFRFATLVARLTENGGIPAFVVKDAAGRLPVLVTLSVAAVLTPDDSAVLLPAEFDCPSRKLPPVAE